jgi:hypothetical protein
MRRIFDITISQTLSKSTWIETDDFKLEYDMLDEEGPRAYCNTENTNWYRAVEEDGTLTPLELINEFGRFLTRELCKSDLTAEQKLRYQRLIDNCNNWIDDSTVIIPE